MKNFLGIIIGSFILFGLIGLSSAYADLGLMSSDPPHVYLSDGITSIKATVFPSQYAGYEFAIYQGTTLITGTTTSASSYEFTGLSPSTTYIIKVRGISNGVYSPYYTTVWGTYGLSTTAYCRTIASIPTINDGSVLSSAGTCTTELEKQLTIINENLGQECSSIHYVFPMHFEVSIPYKPYLTKVTRTDVFGTPYNSYAVASAGGCSTPTFDISLTHGSTWVTWVYNPNVYDDYRYEIRLGSTLVASGTVDNYDSTTYDGLNPSTIYTIKLIGLNSCGDGYSVVKTFTTEMYVPIPSPDPFNVTVSNITENSAYVSINPDVASSYLIRTYDVTNSILIDEATVAVPYYNITGLSNSTHYWVSVTSYQVNGTLSAPNKHFTTTSSIPPATLMMNITNEASMFTVCTKVQWRTVGNATFFNSPEGWDWYKWNITLTNGTPVSFYEGIPYVYVGTEHPFVRCLEEVLIPNTVFNVTVTANTSYGVIVNSTTFTTLPFNDSDYNLIAQVTTESEQDYNLQLRHDVDVDVYASLSSVSWANYYSYVLNDSEGNFIESDTVTANRITLENLTVGKQYNIEVSPSITTAFGNYPLATKYINFTPNLIPNIECNSGSYSNNFSYVITIDGDELNIRIVPEYLTTEDVYILGAVNATVRDVSQNVVGTDYEYGNRQTIQFNGLLPNVNYTVNIVRTISCEIGNGLDGNSYSKSFNIQLSNYGYGILTSPMSWVDVILPSQMAKFVVTMMISAIIGLVLMYVTKQPLTGLVPTVLGFIICAGLGWVPMVVWGIMGVIATIGAIYLIYAKLSGG
jgi:hypothetical protein